MTAGTGRYTSFLNDILTLTYIILTCYTQIFQVPLLHRHPALQTANLSELIGKHLLKGNGDFPSKMR